MNIGIIIGRIGGVDGVALETEKWIEVLQSMGHKVYTLSGQFQERPMDPETETLVSEMSFFSPESFWSQKKAFFYPETDPRELVEHLDAYGLIFCGAFTLFLSSLPAKRASISLPESSRGEHEESEVSQPSLFAGFQLVLGRRYLMLLAAFVIMLNLVNTTGEYLLASLIENMYAEGIANGAISSDKGTYVGRFYSGFYFMVNLLGVLIQFFAVSRLLRHAGFSIALLLTPLVVFLGYASLAILPILAWFRYFKVVENSMDYSLQNTARQMLYLPLSRQEKYEGRAVIDSFGQRIGDLLQAGLIFLGIHWLGFETNNFIPVVAVLAGINLIIVYNILRERSHLLKLESPEHSLK